MSEAMDRADARRWFGFGCLVEVSVGILAGVVGYASGLPWASTIAWSGRDAAWGVAGTLPMLALFWWMLQTRWEPIHEITRFLDQAARPVMGQWSSVQFGIISLIAGVSEELLFRAVAQGGLTVLLGPGWGLVLASGIFGAFHCVTRAYAVVAALMGVYLGLLWNLTGNLLTPVITHALYDFIALAWLFKLARPLAREPE